MAIDRRFRRRVLRAAALAAACGLAALLALSLTGVSWHAPAASASLSYDYGRVRRDHFPALVDARGGAVTPDDLARSPLVSSAFCAAVRVENPSDEPFRAHVDDVLVFDHCGRRVPYTDSTCLASVPDQTGDHGVTVPARGGAWLPVDCFGCNPLGGEVRPGLFVVRVRVTVSGGGELLTDPVPVTVTPRDVELYDLYLKHLLASVSF